MAETRRTHRVIPRLALAAGLVVAAAAPLAAQAPAAKPQPPKSATPAPAALQAPAADAVFRMKAWDTFTSMRGSSPFKDLKWQFIGPTSISGRVVDLAVANRKGRTRIIYVATAEAGLWKTENEGSTFEPVFDQAASVAGGSVEVAPSDPTIVWFGTGEANIFRSSNAGVGIFKSADGGKTWQHMGLARTHTIARIVVHPADPDIVYVAAGGHEWTDNEDRGVFKTTDGGKTWAKVLYVDAKTAANDLAMDPADPNVLYATTWQRIRQKWNDPRTLPGYTGSGIWKTTDAGRTWAPIDEGLPAPDRRGRIGIDAARSNPNVVYAFVDNYEIARPARPGEVDSYGRQKQGAIKGAEIYRSDNKGQTWRKASESNAFMEGAAATYGWVFSQIRVDPTNENVVYFEGLALNQSTDGGKTFKVLRGMHGDHHALWIDPANPDNLIDGNDGGVVMSYDGGKNWRLFTGNLPAVTFFNVEFDNGTPLRVYGSVQDHGSYRAVVDLARGRDKIPAQPWEETLGGEGTTHAIDKSNNSIVYASSFYGNLDRADLTKPGRQNRWGDTVPFEETNIMPRAGTGEPALRGQWMAPTIVSPHDPNVVYHGLQYVYRSMHRGDAWERISPDLTGNDPKMFGDIPYQTLFALAESPMRFGLLYAGTDDGRLWVTRDGGKAWTELTANLPQKKWISRVVPSAFDEGTVYVAQNGKRDDEFAAYIYKSIDYGKTFKSIAGNIPAGPVNVIREDPTSPKILYVGTDMGVYVTVDGGATWSVLGGNLPQVYVLDLNIQPRDHLIAIATHGRGVWVKDAVGGEGRQ
jgi:photosystem II stability/assembly factor-like uncharacterized protein